MKLFPRYAALFAALVFGSSLASSAQEGPRVVADILPVHSLVAQVMQGVGAPGLLLEAGSDPHSHAMRPSQAELLERADVVITIGPSLTPWLEKPLSALASGAVLVSLLDIQGTTLLEYRGSHDHGHGHEDHGDGVDPHAWLDPSNARVWLTAIAEVLADKDPTHGDIYRQNAKAAREALSQLGVEWESLLTDIGLYGVHHDAFQYFEARFDLEPTFVVKEDDVHQPGPARIAELRAEISHTPVSCVFVEPFVNRGLIETLLEGTEVQILELDPIGARLEPGPELYSLVFHEMTQTMAKCR